jgi:hypothetical protein
MDYYSNDDFSDTSSEYDEEFLVDKFLDIHMGDVVDLYMDFKEHFESYNPKFLEYLKSTDLVDFVVKCIFDPYEYEDTHEAPDTFLEDYINEIGLSYQYLKHFVSKFKGHVDYSSWAQFCYTNSNNKKQMYLHNNSSISI